MLVFIADIARQALKTGVDDITNDESHYVRGICWRNLQSQMGILILAIVSYFTAKLNTIMIV
jgi:hypothetical protein